ncbi:unnamed protein product, partial [marine sediment metagenome]
MVDKKTAAIAALCVITILCARAQESNRLKGELLELEDDYENLARVRTSLEEGYIELRTEKEDLESEHSTLETDYFTLQREYESLTEEIDAYLDSYRTLTEDYESLTEELDTYLDSYRILKQDYDELNALFEAGEAIAESSEWITEDERLKVTSKLIPDMWDSYLSGYTVRVTIENIGDEPMDT